MENAELELEQGKIYSVVFGPSVQIIGRYSHSDACNHFFYDSLHYWNGYQKFTMKSDHCVKSGITEIRRATLAEKHSLIRFELENDCI